MSKSLYHPLPNALTTLFSTLDGHAKSGAPVFAGSAGTIVKRSNQNGTAYFVRRYYNGEGRQQETYLGVAGEVDTRVDELRAQIEEVKAQVSDLRLLAREGYQVADAKTYATLASLAIHGLFTAGATLIGSHAFGVLLNQMGIRSAAYATEDIDLARREVLAFQRLPEKDFLEMLRDSGIDFVEVPALDRKQPATSFKQQGKSRFHVDLLVPSQDNEIRVIKVPELRTHATALPYLAYVLGQTHMGTLIGREGCFPVRVPVPERFAIHKLIVSQLRTSRDAKTTKDIQQAAVLLAVLGDHYPGAIDSAIQDLPISARKYVMQTLPTLYSLLIEHPRALDELAASTSQ